MHVNVNQHEWLPVYLLTQESVLVRALVRGLKKQKQALVLSHTLKTKQHKNKTRIPIPENRECNHQIQTLGGWEKTQVSRKNNFEAFVFKLVFSKKFY